jgi:Skp family chaperone for outer membrane proteins
MFKKSLLLAVSVLVLVGFYEGIGSGVVSEVDQKRAHAVSLAAESSPPSSEDPKWKEEYRKLEDELKRLLEELKRLEKNMEDKVQNEIIPFLRKEIEKLRERIRRFRMDEKPRESERPVRT